MRIFLSLAALLPGLSFGFIPSSGVEGKPIWVQNGQFIIDRGGEDGLVPGEFVQVFQNKRYKSRAVSLKVYGDHSLWAVYNFYEPLTFDKSVLLRPSAQHPFDERTERTMNLNIPPDEELEAVLRPRPKRAVVEREDADLILDKRLRAKVEERRKADRENYAYLAPSDLTMGDTAFKVNLAPFRFNNISDSHEAAYKISLKRDNPDKHFIDAELSYERDSFVYSLTSAVTSKSRYHFRLFYEYNKIGTRFRPFTFASFERLREHTFYPIRAAGGVGPIGIKYNFTDLEEKATFLDEFSLSYIPIVDYLNRDTLIVNPLTGLVEVGESTEVNLRHGLIFRGRTQFFRKKMALTNTTFFRPIQELGGLSIDFSDINLRVETEFSYKFHPQFSVGYINLALNDQRSERASNLPSTEIVHLITANYEKRF